MLKNYLKIAVRNLLKHRAYSLINIAGLAVGMASTIVMLLFVQYHFNFDRFHENGDRVYRVVTKDSFRQSRPLGQALVDELPEVEAYAAFWPYNKLMRIDRSRRRNFRQLPARRRYHAPKNLDYRGRSVGLDDGP